MRYEVRQRRDERGEFWTVVDSETLEIDDRGCYARVLCRTARVADADLICAALNAAPGEIRDAISEAREGLTNLRDRLSAALEAP